MPNKRNLYVSIDQDYGTRFAQSRLLNESAARLIPGGINHDVRRMDPFPIYMSSAAGCLKWDVDENQFIDFGIGHGALILGHAHPAVVAAMQRQVRAVTHASAPTELEVRWAELVMRLVPSAERVRFVVSGTEASMLAMRLARAHTGRSVIARIEGHYHGWHDYALLGWLSPFDVPSSAGIPTEVAATVRTVPLNDLDALDDALAAKDVAGLIMEPDGPRNGTVPIDPEYLRGAREVTRRHGALLIFDEVITGFRVAPGGAQEHFKVLPDMSLFAKILGGGMPAGAVAGRTDVMNRLAHRNDQDDRLLRVAHMGTYSAHPTAAAAGVVALTELRDGTIQNYTAALADRLRLGLNSVLRAAHVAGCAYGLRSSFRIIVAEPGDLPLLTDPTDFLATVVPARLLDGTRQPLRSVLQRALLLEGIDLLSGTHGWLSQAHTEIDVDAAVVAFERALNRVLKEGKLKTSS